VHAQLLRRLILPLEDRSIIIIIVIIIGSSSSSSRRRRSSSISISSRSSSSNSSTSSSSSSSSMSILPGQGGAACTLNCCVAKFSLEDRGVISIIIIGSSRSSSRSSRSHSSSMRSISSSSSILPGHGGAACTLSCCVARFEDRSISSISIIGSSRSRSSSSSSSSSSSRSRSSSSSSSSSSIRILPGQGGAACTLSCCVARFSHSRIGTVPSAGCASAEKQQEHQVRRVEGALGVYEPSNLPG